jgi:hypothetical protein
MVDAAFARDAKAQGIIVQTPEYVALGAVMLTANKEWNGKSMRLPGFKAAELGDKIRETTSIWKAQHGDGSKRCKCSCQEMKERTRNHLHLIILSL